MKKDDRADVKKKRERMVVDISPEYVRLMDDLK